MVPIAERGEDAAQRRVPGHWEGDLIIGKNGTSCAATLVERMSGFTGLLALPSKHAEPTADAVIEFFNDLPEMMKASLAWDQGSEMAQHAKVSLATAMPVYFADPHSPWQRPSNENTNRLYREYLPGANPEAWVERSHSGRGLHVWGLLDEGPGRTTKEIEVYSRGRYIALGTTFRAGGLTALVVPAPG